MRLFIYIILIAFIILGVVFDTFAFYTKKEKIKNIRKWCRYVLVALVFCLVFYICFDLHNNQRICTQCESMCDTQYCSVCGTKTTTQKELLQQKALCPNCKKEFRQDFRHKFCPYCGWEATIDQTK